MKKDFFPSLQCRYFPAAFNPGALEGGSILLESDVHFDISVPVKSPAFNIEIKGNVQKPPIFTPARRTND